MDKSQYCLETFGLSAYSVNSGITDEMTRYATVKVKELSQAGSISSLLDITNKLLDTVEDAKYTPIWLMLLDGLSQFSHREDVHAVFLQLMKKQDSLSKEVLHKLWISYLPSLESAVVKLVERVCSDESFPCTVMIQDMLMKSNLIVIASREYIISCTISRMLMALVVDSDFAPTAVDIAASFAKMVRNMQSELSCRNMMQNISSPHGNITTIETMLRSICDPQSISSESIVHTICEMYNLWTKNRQTVVGVPAPSVSPQLAADDVLGKQFEQLWHLTVEFRDWISAALNAILSCEAQFVESCLWLIAAYHRIDLSQRQLQPLKEALKDFVNCLRDHLYTSCLDAEQASQIKTLAAKTRLAMDSQMSQLQEDKGCLKKRVASCGSIIMHILMAFFLLSESGLTIGEEFLTLVTNSKDACVQARCLVYHYHMLHMTSQLLSSEKNDHFQSLAASLRHRMMKENMMTRNIPYCACILGELTSLSTACP